MFFMFAFISFLIAFQNLLFKKTKKDIFILFLNETKCSLPHLDFDYQEKYIMYYLKAGLHGRIFITHVILAVFFCVY